MTEPTPAVYEAAAQPFDVALRPIVVGSPFFRAAVDSAYAAGVADGRAQAAADIRAMAADERAIFNRFGEPADAIADALEDAATITEGGGAR